jgi:small basic protein (TIGR04137 family)
MSMDSSLKLKNALVRHRNVLTRAERIETLMEKEEWEEGRTVFGLPKIAHRKVTTKSHKPAKAAEAEGEAAEGEEGEAPAEGEATESNDE